LRKLLELVDDGVLYLTLRDRFFEGDVAGLVGTHG